MRQYRNRHGKRYFWRTKSQQEIDYIEEADGQFSAWEFKWNPKTTARFPSAFLDAYRPVETAVISPDNFEFFLQ
jgi:hypothetical protein